MLLRGFHNEWAEPQENSEDVRVGHYQKVANEVRRALTDGAALARASIAEIRLLRSKRSGHPDNAAKGCAYIIDQLKHPAEAQLLRQVYGDAFYLVGGHACWSKRVEDFSKMIAESHNKPGQDRKYQGEATELIDTDDEGQDDLAQNMRATYPQADVFVDLNPDNAAHAVSRFIDLIFGHPFHTPNPEEYAMYLASAVSLRSSDRNRQVGAVIAKTEFESSVGLKADVLAVGINEVPRGGGYSYCEDCSPDPRDQALELDNDDRAKKIKIGILAEIIDNVNKQKWLRDEENVAVPENWLIALSKTQFINIGEFSRPVHAEMAAIIDAARRGVCIDNCSLYVTTFPCHNCAKHIVAAGIRQVIYLEPYPKSRAESLYREELICDSRDGAVQKGKVVFCAYSGIAPRQYAKLFSMSRRGGRQGVDLKDFSAPSKKIHLRPSYVGDYLWLGYVQAERDALIGLQNTGYHWDENVICPKMAR